MHNSNSYCCPFCHAVHFTKTSFCGFCNKPMLLRRNNNSAPDYSVFNALADLFQYPVFKGFIAMIVVIVVFVCSITLLMKNLKISNIPQFNKQLSANLKPGELPTDAWFKQSVWSFFYKYPSVHQIIAKNAEETGGAAAIQSVKTLKMNGDVAFYKNTAQGKRGKTLVITADKESSPFFFGGKISMITKLPNKRFCTVRITGIYDAPNPGLEVQQGFDGGQGWQRLLETNINGVVNDKIENSDTENFSELNNSSVVDEMFSYNDKNLRLTNVGQTDDKTYFEITRQNADGESEIFRFDAVTGYLIEMQIKKFTVKFDNYRKAGNLKLPFKLLYSFNDTDGKKGRIELEVDEWIINPSTDDSIFQKPSFSFNR